MKNLRTRCSWGDNGTRELLLQGARRGLCEDHSHAELVRDFMFYACKTVLSTWMQRFGVSYWHRRLSGFLLSRGLKNELCFLKSQNVLSLTLLHPIANTCTLPDLQSCADKS